jgi:hypothetical protein
MEDGFDAVNIARARAIAAGEPLEPLELPDPLSSTGSPDPLDPAAVARSRRSRPSAGPAPAG